MRRRQAILGAAAIIVGGPARAAPSTLPSKPSLIVAGPAGSPADHWAEIIAGPLGRQLLGDGTLPRENVGGADGVTGVNQFEARANPDGSTALLLPGSALLAWLVGDTRARFDAGAWAPLWGGTTTAIVATRAPLTPGRTIRLAAQNAAGAELEALMALDLMGIDAAAVAAPATAALHRPDIDAVYLRGSAARQFAAQPTPGWRPAFALAAPTTGQPSRDPAFPDIPHAGELFTPARAADPAAFRAVCAAASLDIALVLPAVAPAAVLAWWRRGCDQLDDEAPVRAAASAAAMRQVDSGQVATQLSQIALDLPALLSLRTLLADRYHWRPS